MTVLSFFSHWFTTDVTLAHTGITSTHVREQFRSLIPPLVYQKTWTLLCLEDSFGLQSLQSDLLLSMLIIKRLQWVHWINIENSEKCHMANLNKDKLEISTTKVLESMTGEGTPDDSELLYLPGHTNFSDTSHVNPQWRGGFPLL